MPRGRLAAAVQFLGLIRWPFLVPFLAEQEDSEAVDLVFQAFNRYLGVPGIVIGAALMVCSLEFVGRRVGWTVAEKLTPPAYVAWSLWLIATGVVLL